MNGTNDRVGDDPGGSPTELLPAPRPPGADPDDSRLDDVMTSTLRRWARPTTLAELERRGVKRVRSVSMARMAALLEKAVNRALIQRSIDGDVDQARSLSTTARRAFLEFTRREVQDDAPVGMEVDWGAPDDARLHRRAVSTLDRLRRELETRRRELNDHERELDDVDADGALDDDVRRRITELFARHAGDDDMLLEREVQSLVASELGAARRRTRLVQVEEFEREIAVLERRVAKLSTLLGETESALAEARSGGVVEAGVASIYDRVQGIDASDDALVAKTELMRAIFEANLALRRD